MTTTRVIYCRSGSVFQMEGATETTWKRLSKVFLDNHRGEGHDTGVEAK